MAGGRIPEDNEVGLARNGKPSKAYRDSLHVATDEDMIALTHATLETLIAGDMSFHMKVSYLTKFPEDFPVGKIIKKEGKHDIRVLKAWKVLEWLRKHGYTTATVKQLQGLKSAMTQRINLIDLEEE